MTREVIFEVEHFLPLEMLFCLFKYGRSMGDRFVPLKTPAPQNGIWG